LIHSKIIIGAGLYGLYAALICAKRGENVLILEYDPGPFMRASYINQARIHMGYHYPRSYSTAKKTAIYFEKFCRDYKASINSHFQKIYAIASEYSWTNSEQFIKFCNYSEIPCEPISTDEYFNFGLCEGAFITKEYAYDAKILYQEILKTLNQYPNAAIIYNARIKEIKKFSDHFSISLEDGSQFFSDFVINTSYASVNQVLKKAGFQPFFIKYELCEIILCRVNENLKNLGITVMDGPFFSIMPFGLSGMHSLTSVTFTPHKTSYDVLPKFDCQALSQGYCSPDQLGNCNNCDVKPRSAWEYMSTLARKFLKPHLKFEYDHSLFSIKPILQTSELDDSRPTVIKYSSKNPTFMSVLSGKINTIYDLKEELENTNA